MVFSSTIDNDSAACLRDFNRKDNTRGVPKSQDTPCTFNIFYGLSEEGMV